MWQIEHFGFLQNFSRALRSQSAQPQSSIAAVSLLVGLVNGQIGLVQKSIFHVSNSEDSVVQQASTTVAILLLLLTTTAITVLFSKVEHGDHFVEI